MRRRYPRWGKDKLVVLLRAEGRAVLSTSMVGRILKRLKRRGLLVEPLRTTVAARKRWRPRPWAKWGASPAETLSSKRSLPGRVKCLNNIGEFRTGLVPQTERCV